MNEGALYRVGIRRVVNRPDWVTYETLRFDGIGSGKTRWVPEHDAMGGKLTLLSIDQIASLEEVAA